MRGSCSVLAALLTGLVAATTSPAAAAEMKDMLGKWQWTDYTVEVKECRAIADSW